MHCRIWATYTRVSFYHSGSVWLCTAAQPGTAFQRTMSLQAPSGRPNCHAAIQKTTKSVLGLRYGLARCRRGSLVPCRTAAVKLDTLLDGPGKAAGAGHAGATAQQQDQSQNKSQHSNTAPQSAQSEDVYNWKQAWYPLAAVSALKEDAPTAHQLLGMRVVVWWDKVSQSWRCFEDLCPHRLAPLSEGRIHESGQLQCTYHGWTFDTTGACSSIPQLGDPKAHATACASSRSCVKSFPVCVDNGLLWVYADSNGPQPSSNSSSGSGSGVEQQQQQQQQLRPPAELLLPEGYQVKSPWFQRDVPLSYDILLENFLDPAHVPHSHHGVVGDRNTQHTLSMHPVRPLSSAGGFSVTVQSPARWGPQDYELDFSPPCLVRHNFPGVTMLLYGVPTAPGHSRIIMSFVAPTGSSATRPATPQLPPLVNFMQDMIDKFPALQHALNRNAIIDGDTYFLHAAERVLYERGDYTSWRRQYFMPGSSDAAVVAWRRWLDTHGLDLPTLPRSAGDMPPLMPREQVLDRLKQHTQVCPHCSSALRWSTIAAGIMAAVAAVAAGSIVAAVLGGSAALVSPFTGAAAAVAAVAGLAAVALIKFRGLFIFTDYVHAEH